MSTQLLLYQYPRYKQSIQNIREQILSRDGVIDRVYPSGISNYDLETPPNYSNEFHSTTETYAIKNIKLEESKIKELEHVLNDYVRVTKAIEKALDKLRAEERRLIELKYFEKKTFEDIDEEIPISTAKRWHKKIMPDLDIELRYVKALK